MFTTAGIVLFSVLFTADSPPPVDARMERSQPTPEAERLLRVVEDEGQSSKERTKAIDQLGKRREAAVVPRLQRLLPGEGDVITYKVVIAMGQIGDRRALPALEKMRDDPNLELPGKIRSALDGAIDALSKPQGRPGAAEDRPRK